MVQTFKYRSPTTPGNPGWVVDLGNQAVRLGDESGLITHAELGVVGVSSLRFDDPTGTAGHNGDAIVGLKQFSVFEGDTTADRNRVWEGYIGDRRYYRGSQGVSPGLRTGAARVIDMTLVDLNAFLSFRVFVPTSISAANSFNRPAETDAARVAALLGVGFLSTTLFDNGLVSTASPVSMDAVDYTGQHAADVLNDCAQQSGKNFFVYYDETHGEFSLFYDFNDSQVFLTTMQFSNVLSDVDNTTTFSPLEDAVLTRDPSRISAGVLIQNGSNSVYESDVTTGYAYLYKDAVGNSQNIKTVAQAKVRADRYLAENATEDDRLTWTARIPSANVNDWYAGQAGKVRFSHLPGYENLRQVRVLQRTVKQVEKTASLYDVYYEATPMKPQPAGAFDVQRNGISYSGQPTLPRATVAGDLLILVLSGGGNTTVFPTDVRMKNNPSVSPAAPEVPPFTGHAGWTVVGIATTDYSGQNIGGPCGIPYHAGGGVCTAGLISAIAWRRVQAGEESTVPVAVSTNFGTASLSAWLWNVGSVPDPTGTAVTKDAQETGNAVTATLPSVVGNAVGVAAFALSAGHGNVVQPTAASGGSGTLVQCNANASNHDLPAATNADNWTDIVQLPAGGAISLGITAVAAYAAVNWCGVGMPLPAGVILPTIPYPANHT